MYSINTFNKKLSGVIWNTEQQYVMMTKTFLTKS